MMEIAKNQTERRIVELGGVNSYKQILCNSLEIGITQFYQEGHAIPKKQNRTNFTGEFGSIINTDVITAL